MKKVYLIGGTMGVGKTSVCQYLKKELSNCVFLDGDWCWDSFPFVVNEETKTMVIDNIVYLLNNFIHCSAYEHILFCWVMHEQSILDELLSRLHTEECDVFAVSLVCRPEELERRLRLDVERGLRTPDVIARSLPRLPLYGTLRTEKIDVSDMSVQEAAGAVARLAGLG